MSDIVIRAENLGKKYIIGHKNREKYSTLRDVIANKTKQLIRKTGSVLRGNQLITGTELEEFWALKEINFEIKQGDSVGIIGRNGSGKSTLLKIISRITDPTTGRISLQGKVASLLEVGTGFHQELTGGENIYLNGAILGMSRKEIKNKFDEIVDFSGIEKFLDTPVKRYSSGMYVRLAFAIAAHLESEILIVDEVLAVGDAEFQKKCLGKMSDAAHEGRTVLFVSHDMGAIMSLCTQGILLENGKILINSNIKDAFAYYISKQQKGNDGIIIRSSLNAEQNLLLSAKILNKNMQPGRFYEYGDELNIILETNASLTEKFGIEIRLKNSKLQHIAYLSSWIAPHPVSFLPGQQIHIRIPHLNLSMDDYYLDFICRMPGIYHADNWWDAIQFSILNSRPEGSPISIKASDDLGNVIMGDAEFMSMGS